MMSSDQIDKSEDEQKFEESSKAPKKRIRKTKITNLNNKKTGGIKKKAGRKRLKNKPKKNNLDSDTEKFIKSFKKSNISHKKTRRVQDHAVKQPVNSGPIVQKTDQKILINQNWIECSTYVVKNQTINLNDEEDTIKYKSVVPREKSVSKTSKVNEAEVKACSFCHLKSNEIYGIGELFGPYYTETEQEDDADAAEQIFVHEGCAIWSKNIFVFENKVHGLEDTVIESKDYKCSNCDKNGASLICKIFQCGKMYHYPCAVKNGKTLNNLASSWS